MFKVVTVCLLDGSWVLNIPTEASLVEYVDRYYATMKLVQSYYGAFEEVEDSYGAPSQESTSAGKEIDEVNRGLQKLREN